MGHWHQDSRGGAEARGAGRVWSVASTGGGAGKFS